MIHTGTSLAAVYGWLDLTLIIAHGTVWTVVLAIQLAIAHHIRVAIEREAMS